MASPLTRSGTSQSANVAQNTPRAPYVIKPITRTNPTTGAPDQEMPNPPNKSSSVAPKKRSAPKTNWRLVQSLR